MTRPRRRLRSLVVPLLVVVLLVTSAAAAPLAVSTAVAASPSDGTASPARDTAPSAAAAARTATDLAGTAAATDASTPHGGVHIDFTTSLTPERPGEVTVTATFSIPDGATSLTATVPAGATVTNTEGFYQRGPRQYEWSRSTDRPSLTYRWSVNETVTRGREGAETSGHVFVDTGDWALTRAPSLGVTYSGAGERQPIHTEQSVDGPGVAGESLLFLGPVETTSRRVDGQQITLAVPQAATLRESRADVLESLVGAARAISLGPADERVLAIAAPTDGVQYGSTGLQRGPSDFWVRDSQRLDTPDNVWVHEYVHTRQDYRPTSETRWTYEGMADYYAAKRALQSGRINYSQFRRHLGGGARPRYQDVVLSQPDTWSGTTAHYWKGALVSAAIDRQIRIESNGSATLQDATSRAQEQTGGARLTQSAFLDSVGAVAGPDARAFARRYTETDAVPATWNRSEHTRVFGGLADIDYRFASFRVEGPYRTTTADRIPPLAAGERVVVRVVAENTGDALGDYSVTLRRGGRAVSTRSGELAAGESTTLTWTVPFDEPAETALRIGETDRQVTVRPPAPPAVTDLQVPATVATGEPVAVRAVVGNPAGYPAGGTVTLTADNRTLTEREVRLAPGESVRIARRVAFSSPGEYTVSAGNRTATVTVREETPTPTPAGTGTAGGPASATASSGGFDNASASGGNGTGTASATSGTPADADGDGFGVLAALLAVALALGARRRG